MALEGFILLVAGGILYSIGSIIYAKKSALIKIPLFGFHEIFHVFILLGSISHFIMINNFVLIE